MSRRAPGVPLALRVAPALTVAVFSVPIAAGLAGTLLPAFGVLPAIGHSTPGGDAWRALFALPGLAGSVRLSAFTGVAATLAALLIALGLAAALQGQRWSARLAAAIAPLMATPHAALAIGLAFLVAPSGWIARALSPGLTGWDLPPDLLTVGHPSGWPIVASLLVKEVPYLLLMTLGALHQVPVARALATARSLGQPAIAAWLKAVLPAVYPQLRLPVLAVLAYSLSTVDVALILGPSDPPPLAVLAVRLYGDPDPAMALPGAAAATLLLALVAVALAAWRGGEVLVARLGRRWIEAGHRGPLRPAGGLAVGAGALLLGLAVAALAGLALWSVAQSWRFPAAWPAAWTLATWERQAASLAGPAAATVTIAATATAIALGLALACLEHEAAGRFHGPGAQAAARRATRLLYLPLLVPQVAFLFGTQVMLVRLRLDGTLAGVVWTHLVYVLPYVFLSLADPWRAFDPRYERSALALGRSRAATFFAVKLPMLAAPVLVAAAVGFAVSAGLYLPTLFAGGGRVATLTTEAVTLATGADRRVIGAWAVLQAALPLAAYAAALALPRLLFAGRRGMVR